MVLRLRQHNIGYTADGSTRQASTVPCHVICNFTGRNWSRSTV